MEIAAPPIASCSKEHQKIYQEWFACADSDGDGRLTGGDAIKFFSMSNLSRAELKQVWAIADSKRQGFLGFKEFITAMQLIGLAQSGNEISQDTLHADLANLNPPVMNGLDILLAKKRSPKKSEPELNVTQPQIPSSVQWFSSKSTKKIPLGSVTSIIDGLKRLYIEKLKPLEIAYRFNDFASPALTSSDFDAKPMVMLLGQYSTGKTTFIKHLLKSSYPGAHIGPEPTTDRFVVVIRSRAPISGVPLRSPRRRSALLSAMASQQTAPAAPAAAGSTPSAQVVGNAFVHQYYHILHQSPEYVYRFYLEGSKLGRPDSQGGMSSVTGMEAINQKILSLDYSEIRAEIKTVDAQESLEGGVIVLVTGYLTGKDDVRRNFTQSFFLATQDKGYYVLNDIFRYVEDSDPLAAIQVPVTTPEQETPPPQEQQISERSVPEPEQEEDDEVDEEDDEVIDEDLFNPSDHEEALDEDEEIPVEEVIDEVEVPNSSPPLHPVKAEPNFVAAVPEEQPKKSYASIVKVKNVAPPAAPVPAPARPAPVKPVSQVVAAPVPAPTPEAPAASSNSTETSSIQEAEADSHSVYIKNLPLSATPAQLEEEFKKFGSIKTNGIQVRSHKQGFCFGFVEFEDASSVQTAIEASPITIGGRPAYVEEKRPAGSRGGNRGRFLPARGGYWNDGVRGRGGFGGRGYGRSDYGNRVDFGGRGGGRGGVSNRGGGGEGGYQRVDSMGGSNGGRGNRPGSMAANGPSRTFAPRVPAPA